MRERGWSLLTVLVVLMSLPALPAAEVNAAAPVYTLEQFGPIATPAQADAALEKAAKALIAAGGGFLVIPLTAPAAWVPENITQGTWRTPRPPAPANTDWGNTPSITLIDYRGGTPRVLVPQLTGLTLQRDLRLAEGESCGHWGYFPMLKLANSIYRGTTSYRDWLIEDVKAGKDRRFYVKTLRGIFPGMFLNSGDYGAVQRLYVKSVGYDAEKRAAYFVADTDADIPVNRSILHNKNHANALLMETYAHTENQTFDVFMNRHHYSQGDAYMFAGHFNYMGDVHSAAGDENGVIYAAFSISEADIFRGQVAAFTRQTQELQYTGARNAHTLASGRPLINMNPRKWITGGKAYIMPPGGAMLGWGSSIRSQDAPWTPEVVGRYFAVDEPDEYVPGATTVRRWWLITGFSEKDGVKTIGIQRQFWGAKDNVSITGLYNPANFTADEARPKLLSYIIAPGANVYDVARGVRSGVEHSGGALERILKVTPGPQTGSAVDFAPDDPIEQAIGPDPFKPIPFRAWLFDAVPGAFPSPALDIANHGHVSRSAVMTVAGGSSNLDDNATRADKRPPWDNILLVESASGNGIVFGGDTANAALLFRQPNNRAQRITWLYAGGAREATLTVSPQDGALRYDGGGASVPGGLLHIGGVSGTGTTAHNLRGINVAVPAGARELAVTFPRAEADEAYAVFLELSWLTNRAVVSQTREGFVARFETPPATPATLHWLLVR